SILANLRQHITSVLTHVELRVQAEPVYAMAGGEPEEAMAEERATGRTGRPLPPPRTQRRTGSGNGADRAGPRPAGPRAPWAGTPRNAPCPCGSGRQFKPCHGRV